MKQLLIPVLLIYHVLAAAQERKGDVRLPEQKRFIDKVEVFAGTGLGLNHGNMFIENYKDANIENRRLLKAGYTLGFGFCHPVYNRVDINARFLFEQKGTKAELNHPLNPVNNDARQVLRDEYAYNYLTIGLAPRLYIDSKLRLSVLFGLYYSRIKGINGFSRAYNTQDFQINEGEFEGRYFYHLREDGGMDGFTWIPGLMGFELIDYGTTLAIGYAIPIKGNQNLTIQISDNFGLININKDNPYGLEEKNHSVSLIVGYIFQRSSKK